MKKFLISNFHFSIPNFSKKNTAWTFVLGLLFIIGLIYVLLPGPSRVEDFPPLPESVKSDLPGDTIQNPNIAAYYSNYQRDFLTKIYQDAYEKLLIPGIKLPSIRLNHRPEDANKYVRDQQESTFLEEYIFPFRGSLFVNGYEPEVENKILNRTQDFIGNHIEHYGNYYVSKATIRFYPSSLISRVFVYVGVWILAICLIKVFQKMIKNI